MATKADLQKELEEKQTAITVLKENLESSREVTNNLSEEKAKLESSVDEKDQQLKELTNRLASKADLIIKQETQITMMEERLKESWDKNTAEEVMKIFLDALPLQC